MNINKEIMIFGAGASVGVIQTIVTKEYVDANFGNFPGVGDMLPYPWGKWSTFGNILIGGVFFGLTTFTSVIRNKNFTVNGFLQMYGLTTLIGGIMNGIFPGGAPASRASRARRSGLRISPRIVARAGGATPTGIPPVTVVA